MRKIIFLSAYLLAFGVNAMDISNVTFIEDGKQRFASWVILNYVYANIKLHREDGKSRQVILDKLKTYQVGSLLNANFENKKITMQLRKRDKGFLRKDKCYAIYHFEGSEKVHGQKMDCSQIEEIISSGAKLDTFSSFDRVNDSGQISELLNPLSGLSEVIEERKFEYNYILAEKSLFLNMVEFRRKYRNEVYKPDTNVGRIAFSADVKIESATPDDLVIKSSYAYSKYGHSWGNDGVNVSPKQGMVFKRENDNGQLELLISPPASVLKMGGGEDSLTIMNRELLAIDNVEDLLELYEYEGKKYSFWHSAKLKTSSGYFNEYLKGKFLFFRFYDDGKVGFQMLNKYAELDKKEVILE